MHSDAFVLLDSVQFPRGGTWITRNRFKNDQGSFWMGIPVRRKGRGLQRIDEVRISQEGRWKRKHLESLRCAYADAPYFRDHFPLFEQVFSDTYEKISDMDHDIIRHGRDSLNIHARIMRLSELDVRGRGTGLLVALCRALGASRFLAWGSARKHLDEEQFRAARIEIRYMDPPKVVYPQLWGEFVHNLSLFDLLFTCGPKSREIMDRGCRAAGDSES